MFAQYTLKGDKMKFNHKLVVTDLDGTLVPYYTNRISEQTREMVNRLRQNGVEFTIATGRSWAQTKPIVTELGITLPVIVQAGALIIDPLTEQTLHTQPLRQEIELQLRRIWRIPGTDQFCLCESGLYYATRITTKGGDWLYNFGEECSLVPEWKHQPSEAIKHLFIGSKEDLEQVGLKIQQNVIPTPNLILWPPDQNTEEWYLEVFDPLTSKGQALQWLANYLGVTMETVIAFGDGANDLDMLRLAGVGVAIAGAGNEVLAAADAVTAGPEEDGIVRFLNRFKLK